MRSGRRSATSTGCPTGTPRLIATSEIEDGKAGDQVGGVRSFTLGDGTHLREKLLAHSDREAVVHLRLPEDAVRRRQLPGDDPRHARHGRRTAAFVEWWTTFDCDRDQQEHWTGLLRERDLPERVRGAEEAHARASERAEGDPGRRPGRADLALHRRGLAGGLLFVSGVVAGRRRGEPRRRRRRRRAGAAGVREHRRDPRGRRVLVRRRGQGDRVPHRRRRAAARQPRPAGGLRRRAARLDARRGAAARGARRPDRGRVRRAGAAREPDPYNAIVTGRRARGAGETGRSPARRCSSRT